LNLHTGSNLKTDLRFQRFDFETGILRKYDFQAEPTHQLVCGTAYVVVIIIVVALVPATATVMRNETVDPPTPARKLAPIAAETVVSRRFGGSVSKPHQKCKNNNNNKQKHGFDA
jgi:hypothetical protein